MISSDGITINLNTQYKPIGETISELVLYPYGWMITIGITAVTIIFTLLTLITLSSPASRCHRLVQFAGILFAIIGLGFIIIMVFNTDPGKEIVSLAGGIHYFTFVIISFLFPISCALLSIALWHHRSSESLIIFSAIIAVVSIIIACLAMLQNDLGYLGVFERLLALVNLSWLVMAGFKLPRLLSVC